MPICPTANKNIYGKGARSRYILPLAVDVFICYPVAGKNHVMSVANEFIFVQYKTDHCETDLEQ